MSAPDHAPIISPYKFRLTGCQRFPKDDCREIKDSILPFIASIADIVAAEIMGDHLDLEDIAVAGPYRLEISQHVYGEERYSWGASVSEDHDNRLWKTLLGRALPEERIRAELARAAPSLAEARRAPQAIVTYQVRLADLSNHQRLALAAYRRCDTTESV